MIQFEHMALRVLLADESSTIKKVMQLALQDFGVEVKSVPIGLDVLQVSKSYQPDIIFADVLLSKRSGYDVSAEIKGDPTLRNTPVVLMWSGFMELDEERAKASMADRRLEKPFDADQLRSLVKDLVPRLNENAISNYLSFPDLPEIMETPLPPPVQAQRPQAPPVRQAPAPPQSAPTQAAPTQAPPAQNFRPASEPPPPPPRRAAPPVQPPVIHEPLDEYNPEDLLAGAGQDMDDPDDFQQVPLPGSKTRNVLDQQSRRGDEEEWRQGGLEQFRVSPDSLQLEDADMFADVSGASLAVTGQDDEMSMEQLEDLTAPRRHEAPSQRSQGPAKPAAPSTRTFVSDSESRNSLPQLDPMRAEEVLREQVREVLESIAWKIIPDIAERVVREEIQRLLKDSERLT